jgi:hypothetical protein
MLLEIDLAVVLREIADKKHNKLPKRRMDIEKVAGGAVTIRETAKVNFIENRAIRKREKPKMCSKGKDGEKKDNNGINDVK